MAPSGYTRLARVTKKINEGSDLLEDTMPSSEFPDEKGLLIFSKADRRAIKLAVKRAIRQQKELESEHELQEECRRTYRRIK